MSRVGKKGITIPEKTEVAVSADRVSVKGPLGELSRALLSEVAVSVEGSQVTLTPTKETIEARALWGTFASHITNMVRGVNERFQKKLLLEGIGYKVEVKGSDIHFALGFSHPVVMSIPEGITVTVEKNVIIISGIDKARVGEFAAKIRDLKKPEPYKGKGIRYEGEVIKIKQGKKSA